MAHQLRYLDVRSQAAADAYSSLIATLDGRPESPTRNVILARAKRCFAILRYPSAPGVAQSRLDEAATLLTQFGPPRDRDLIELAETLHLDGIARLRLNMTIKGPQQLNLAEGH